MSNPAYQNYLTELQKFGNAIGKDSSRDKSGSYSGPRDSSGQPNGVGKMMYDDGSVHEGQFLHGLKNGNGIQTWPGGVKYDGEWKDGKMHGKGIKTWSGGDKYEGEWKDEKMDGKGIYTWPNGNKYEGEWKDGKMDGKGIQIFANGKKRVGTWKGDIRVTGEFEWSLFGERFLFEPSLSSSELIIAKCKNVANIKFFSEGQVVLDAIEVKSDLSIKGKVLFPRGQSPNKGFDWLDFEGTIDENQVIIIFGEEGIHWIFQRVE